MESLPEKSRLFSIFKKKISVLISVNLLIELAIKSSFFIPITVFFACTKGSDYCIFTIGSCTDISHKPVNEPIAVVGVVAGITASVAYLYF
jgi:hypothetical protein